MFTATDWIRDKNGLMVLTPFPIKWAGKAAKQVYHKLRQKDTGNEATSRTFLQRKGSVLVQPLSLTSFDSSPSRGASGEEEKFSAMPKPPLQGATATTAASGGNREELLGPRPAGCERQRSRRWEPQPGQWYCEAMTERASPARKSRCTAISRLFVRAILSQCKSCLAASLPSQSLRASSPKGRAFRGAGLQKKLFMNAISLAARAGTASSRRTGRRGWGRARSISKPPL